MHGHQRDCPPGRSLLITTTLHGSEEEEGNSSLRALLFAADTPTTATAAASHQTPSGAQGAIDLDLLLSRDSIDVFDENQHHQSQAHQFYHQQQQQQEGAGGSFISTLARGRAVSNELKEVTAVQAFLEEWQHDDEDEDRSGVDASAVRPAASTSGGSRTLTTPQNRTSGAAQKGTNLITPTGRTVSRPKCIGTREREKEETMQLRREALQLELQLEQLRQSVQLAVRDGENAVAVPLWKSLAERQRERVQLAGMENKSLKIAVRDQKRMAKSLHRILLNRVAQVSAMQPQFKILLPWHETGESPDDQDVFERLMAVGSTMYAQTDRVSRALRAKTPPNGAYRKFDVKQSASGSNKVFLELIDVEELPFSVSQVNNLIQSFSNRIKTSTVRNGNEVVPVTILMSKEHFGAPGSDRLVRMRCVFLNFVERKRSIHVYTSYLDAVDANHKPLPGRILHERKWIIITDKATLDCNSFSDNKSKTGTSAPAGPHKTVMQTYSTIAPMADHPLSRDDAWNRADIEKREIPNWDTGYTMLAQKIENDLLQLAGAR